MEEGVARGLGWHPASSPRLFLHLRPIASPEVRADVFSVNPVGAYLALSLTPAPMTG